MATMPMFKGKKEFLEIINRGIEIFRGFLVKGKQ